MKRKIIFYLGVMFSLSIILCIGCVVAIAYNGNSGNTKPQPPIFPAGGHPDSCSDSDGGIYAFIFGTVSGYFNKVFYNNSDTCIGTSYVLEYYCNGTRKQSTNLSCGTDGYGSSYCSSDLVYSNYTDYFCGSGKCNSNMSPVLQQDCNAQDYYGNNYCYNSSSIYRDFYNYYCSNGACPYSVIPQFVQNCNYGCTNGSCDPIPDSCSDSDGGAYPFTFGIVSGYFNQIFYSNNDSCIDSSNILEYSCSGNYKQSTNLSCGTDFYGASYCSGDSIYKNLTDYYCSSGACRFSIGPVYQDNCNRYDSHGPKYCMNDSVYWDFYNYYCSYGNCSYSQMPQLNQTCTYGCTNGTCNGIPDSCSDTDGGFNINVNGTVFGYKYQVWYSNSDICLTNTTIMEYYCASNNKYSVNFTCNGTGVCTGGRCI